MKKTYSYDEALHRAAALCSMAEKSSADVRRKLADWGIAEADAERILERLTKERFVDDERFSVAFAKDKARFAQWGRVKIAFALRQKSIPENLIAAALAQIDDEAYSYCLVELLKAKQRTLKAGTEYEKNAKLVRFAQSRGFELDQILSTLRKL